MLISEQGKQARATYLSVARQMKQYEDAKYANWLKEVESTLPSLLRRNLLVKVNEHHTGNQLCPKATEGNYPTSLSRGGGDRTKLRPLTALTDINKNEGDQQKVVLAINFAPELVVITNETKYMEQLGFQIPELARNVALQEDKYVAYISG